MKPLLVALLLVGSCFAQEAKPRTTQPSQNGRYQIVLYQGELPPRLNTYLLDTQTGKTWMMKQLPDGSDLWEPIYKVDNDEEEFALALKHQKRSPEKPAQ